MQADFIPMEYMGLEEVMRNAEETMAVWTVSGVVGPLAFLVSSLPYARSIVQ